MVNIDASEGPDKTATNLVRVGVVDFVQGEHRGELFVNECFYDLLDRFV